MRFWKPKFDYICLDIKIIFMETIRTTYTGQLRTEAIHVQSGNKLITDAPTDNHGKGETFSPTDLLATSLASCIFTIMGIKAEASGFNIDGATAKTWKIMSENPRRVAEVKIEFDFSISSFNSISGFIIWNKSKHLITSFDNFSFGENPFNNIFFRWDDVLYYESLLDFPKTFKDLRFNYSFLKNFEVAKNYFKERGFDLEKRVNLSDN